MFSLTFCISVDPMLGKVDKSSFSQHTLLELLTQGLERKSDVWSTQNEPTDFSDWIKVITNASDEVVEIDWACCSLEGSMELQWLPPSVRRVFLYRNRIHGSINMTSLPEYLKNLNLYGNSFSGEIDLKNLPKRIEKIDLSINHLSGSLCLEYLPLSLKSLILSTNFFNGSVCLTRLPPKMAFLSVNKNVNLDGSIDVTKLPREMKELNLSITNFAGETDFSHLPPSLKRLYVNDTQLSGKIYLHDDDSERIFISRNSEVQMYVMSDGKFKITSEYKSACRKHAIIF